MSPAIGYLDKMSEVNGMAAQGMAAIIWILAGLLAVAIVGYARNRRDP